MKLTAINGKLTSPLYPHSYPNNTLCNYSITVAKGKRIHLYFQKFELENQSSCLSDNLKIYEGPNKESSLAETLCGKYDNKQFISASNELFLQMKTNGMISAAGFIANYYTTSLCKYFSINCRVCSIGLNSIPLNPQDIIVSNAHIFM